MEYIINIQLTIGLYIILGVLVSYLWDKYFNENSVTGELFLVGMFFPIVILIMILGFIISWSVYGYYRLKIRLKRRTFKR